MKTVTLSFREDISFGKVEIAGSFFSRLIGLMLRSSFDSGQGMLLKKCSQVHSFFMSFPIDVVYLAANMTVIAKETIYPWKIGRRVEGSRHVLELPKGSADPIKCGMQAVILDGE